MLTKAMIEQMAVNDSALANGKKLADKGCFANLKKTEDSTVYWGECAGSGKNPYRTSVDMSDEKKLPVCRCSCPSRQFPCKHGLALMLLIERGEAFEVDALPEEIAEKRAKAEERETKKAEKAAKPKKQTASSIKAAEKKTAKQLEGLEMARKMTDELMTSGLATLSGTSIQKFRDLATELYNYGLPGPQLIMNRIAESMSEIQFRGERGESADVKKLYSQTLRYLIKLNTIIKKGCAFLSKKIEERTFDDNNDILFEELGGIWKLEELEKIQSFRDNARLVELSFEVVEDRVKDEFQYKSHCIDMDTKEICANISMVPSKVWSKIKIPDSCFEMLLIPRVYKYPGTSRVRWDSFTTRKLTDEDRLALISCAEESFESAVKKFKNYIKNTLHEKSMMMLLPVASIGMAGVNLLIEDAAGTRIRVSDAPLESGTTTNAYCTASFIENAKIIPVDMKNVGAVFGKMFYDEQLGEIRFHIHSLITKECVLRLM